MAYKYRDWTLYKGSVELDEDTHITRYFFSRWTPIKGEPSDLPDGVEVEVNKRTGLPYLKDMFYSD